MNSPIKPVQALAILRSRHLQNVIVPRAGNHPQRLRLIGGIEERLALTRRNHLIAIALQDQQRRMHPGDL